VEAECQEAIEKADDRADHKTGGSCDEGIDAEADEHGHDDGGERVDRANGEIELAGDHQHAGTEREAAENGHGAHHDAHVGGREITEIIRENQPGQNAAELHDEEYQENGACRHAEELFQHPRHRAPGRNGPVMGHIGHVCCPVV
jgi:Cft2 family RNA processing exonuclease